MNFDLISITDRGTAMLNQVPLLSFQRLPNVREAKERKDERALMREARERKDGLMTFDRRRTPGSHLEIFLARWQKRRMSRASIPATQR